MAGRGAQREEAEPSAARGSRGRNASASVAMGNRQARTKARGHQAAPKASRGARRGGGCGIRVNNHSGGEIERSQEFQRRCRGGSRIRTEDVGCCCLSLWLLGFWCVLVCRVWSLF